MVTDWIFEDNLRPFLTALGWVAEYPFGPDDWAAISDGVRASDGHADGWCEYELAARHPVRLRFAHDPGTCVVRVQVGVPAAVGAQARMAVGTFQSFRVRDDSG